jgi:hypothetical protein
MEALLCDDHISMTPFLLPRHRKVQNPSHPALTVRARPAPFPGSLVPRPGGDVEAGSRVGIPPRRGDCMITTHRAPAIAGQLLRMGQHDSVEDGVERGAVAAAASVRARASSPLRARTRAAKASVDGSPGARRRAARACRRASWDRSTAASTPHWSRSSPAAKSRS